MTTYGRMGNIANDFVVTCIAKNGPVKIWCDIHPTTNLFHFKELDRVCSAGAVVGPLDPPKILALEKVANSKSSTSIGVLIVSGLKNIFLVLIFGNFSFLVSLNSI